MILKNYNLKISDLNSFNFFLFYGKNKGLIKEIINNLFQNKEKSFSYEQKDILENQNNFLENILNKSLFEEEKLIIINNADDKILKIIENIIIKKIDDKIIILADNLEKKSKLRSFFEKNKKCACVAFYEDNKQTLSRVGINFLRENKLSLSQENLNLIVEKCSGDRETLLNELKKIRAFNITRRKITETDIKKLINLSEDYSINDLVDNCLVKNTNKVLKILNENNFSSEDGIIILRKYLNKSKKILQLSKDFKNNQDINLTILNSKPPIFWKEKEIIKKQILMWSPEKIKEVIYQINDVELIIKRNVNNSIKIITNFILEKSISKTNS